ncbi:MAG: hypothetical protein ACREC6_14595 [Hyphomicrobiaceae bacterium]
MHSLRQKFVWQYPRLQQMKTMLLVGLVFLSGVVVSRPVPAQTCGSDYALKEGDSLARIALKVYGSVSQWTIVFYANQDRLGSNASLMVPGLAIRIPCLGQQPHEQMPIVTTDRAAMVAPKQTPHILLSAMVGRINFLTADGYTPFAGRDLPSGGLATHFLSTAMNLLKGEAKGRFDYSISWVNDRSAHLNPLLATRAFDAGFPWAKPDCDNSSSLDNDAKYRCQRFLFSEPLHGFHTLLFVKKSSPIQSLRDEELLGKLLCRPIGSPISELDQDGKNWVKDGKVTLVQPESTDECFRLLDNDTVDAVVVSDVAARVAMSALRMADRIRAIERPVATGTLHIIVAKTHPYARTILYYVNTTVAKLGESGDRARIGEEYLSRNWNTEAVTAGAFPKSGPAQTKK